MQELTATLAFLVIPRIIFSRNHTLNSRSGKTQVHKITNLSRKSQGYDTKSCDNDVIFYKRVCRQLRKGGNRETMWRNYLGIAQIFIF